MANLKKIPLNNDWGFTKEFSEELLQDNVSVKLQSVRIPHTVVETPFNYFDEHIYQMVSGYRKEFMVPYEWIDKRINLCFAGVAHFTKVYINGEFVGDHDCGYTAFSIDISDKLKYGANNSIVVCVDSRESLNIPPFGYVIDYMTYGGIYREVYLEVTDKIYIDNVFAIPEIKGNILFDDSIGTELIYHKDAKKINDTHDEQKMQDRFKNSVAKGCIKLHVDIKKSGLDENLTILDNEKISKLQLVCELKDAGKVIKTENKALVDVLLNGKFITKEQSQEAYLEIYVDNINIWDVTNPKLYTLKISLVKEEVLDYKEFKIGFKKSEFRADGFYLNDRKLRIRGLNRHQSFPYVGYAMPDSMQRYDADILRKELGVNAVRTSHYPQSQAFIDRCDELGLLVFTEIPGWQHIGDDEWKNIAIRNVYDMVTQYRNHVSIILWGVRINESVDDDMFYSKTNALARELDPTRATAGVRYLKKSSFFEDVYTYNDFSHDGTNAGVEPKKKVATDKNKAYIISEFNGHMYPTKSYDSEDHRLNHAIRHAKVLNDFYKNKDIAGAFGWCMFDYNTHKDFGSGDRICYHGVMDMFRNPKLAAYVYESMQGINPILEISSSFDIGEHMAGSRGNTYIFTNCDSVKMYKNDIFIKEYNHKDSPFKYLKNAPILIDDYVGDVMIKGEGFSKGQNETVKKCMNYVARFGMNHLPAQILLEGAKALAVYKMSFADAYNLYQKYVGNWGGTSTTFRFEGYKEGKLVTKKLKSTSTKLHIDTIVSNTTLYEGDTYDVASIRIIIKDENDNQAVFYNDPVVLSIEGNEIEIIGPKLAKIAGGMGGTYIKTNGKKGRASIKLSLQDAWIDNFYDVTIDFEIK